MTDNTDRIAVDLGARSYEVRVGQGLLARAGEEISPLLRRRRVAVLTDETVAGLHLASALLHRAAAALQFVADRLTPPLPVGPKPAAFRG